MAESRQTALVKSMGIYTIGSFGSKILTVILLPFCTHYIDADGMGLYDLVYTVVELVKPFAALGLHDALFRWLLDGEHSRRAVVSTWSAVFVGSLAAASLVYWGVWTVVRFDDSIIIWILMLTGCLYMACQLGTRGLSGSKVFATQGILYSIVLCASSLVMVICAGMGYMGLLVGTVLANVVSAGYMLVVQPALRDVSFAEIDRSQVIPMLRYSVPLVPNAVSVWCVNWLSRLIIVVFLGLGANGIYAIAGRFPSAVNALSSVFQLAWSEHALKTYEQKDRKEYFSKMFATYVRGLGSMLWVLIPATFAFVYLFVDPQYVDAVYYVTPLYLSAVFGAFVNFYGTAYLCSKKTSGAAMTTFLGAIVNVVLCLALVVPFGLMGISWAICLSKLAMWVSRVVQTREYFGVDLPMGELVATLVGVCCVTAAMLCLQTIPASLTLTLAGLIAFLVYNRKTGALLMRILKNMRR